MAVKKAVKKVVVKNVKATKTSKSTPTPTRRPRPKRAKVNDILADAMNRLAAVQERNDPYARSAELAEQTKLAIKQAARERAARIKAGTFVIDDLPYVVKVGDVYSSYHQGELIAGKVTNQNLSYGFFGPLFEVTLRVISTMENGRVGYLDYTVRMKGWTGTRTWADLSVRPLTDDIRDRLVNRGRIFRELVEKPSYMNYTGEVYIPSWMGWFPMGGNGRAMVDTTGCRTMQPHILDAMLGEFRNNRDDDGDTKFEIGDDELYMTSPYVATFSFRQKRWVAAKVENFTPIEFQTNVFDKLVLDADKKFVVKSLVEHSGSAFNDIIGGKSGGFVFLLHGPPGVGKTLTAEATAETLKRPLYMVSVGELGTSPQQLETKLAQILELADRWNAVLLLDEADIFLEQRTDHDMERNAMVGIFLRLLEYFNGVMFLTTNRVKNFDKAFHSRISLAINYNEMDDTVRRQVWTNLLTAANISIGKNGVNVDTLVKMPLNGRQIKNSIRLAQTIALAKNQNVDEALLLTMSKYAEEFVTSLGSAENYA